MQLLNYSSVASPESGLFSDWSRNKRCLELSHDWLPVWQCDVRSKNSGELMNSIMVSDEASKESGFLLNASLESFVHKTLEDEQMNAFIELYAMGEMFWPRYVRDLARAPYISYVLFHMSRTANATSKTTVSVVSPFNYC